MKMMTVQELIDLLEEVKDKDRIVIMASDSEGNSYSPLAAVDDTAYYVEDTSHSGYTVDADDREDEDESVPALILGPTN
jgi:hypothetical protein